MSAAKELVNRDELVGILKNLVGIPSTTGSEEQIARYVHDFFTRHGIPAILTGRVAGRLNVVATLQNGSNRSGPLAFNGHIDTVPVGDRAAWITDPYEPVEKEGRLFGLGTADMKGGCAAIMYTLLLLKRAGEACNVQAQLVGDEEKGSVYGAGWVVEEIEKGKIERPTYLLCGEPSDLKLRIGERGVFQFTVKFMGVNSHTGMARAGGKNAIANASRGILALERNLDKYHPRIGYPVISVNKISAGTVNNQVPAECTITVDYRLLPGETKETVLGDVTTALDSAGCGEPGWGYEMPELDGRGIELFSEPYVTAPDCKLVRVVQESYKRLTGKEAEFYVDWGGFSDARLYAYMGIDAVSFGARGERYHGPNESVDIDSVIRQVEVYLEAATSLA